ncbi:MAG: amidohydrolase family protein [Caulobacteraceae bacterium]
MDYKLISCDDHLDLNQLPADLWTSGLPAEFQDRAPHVEEKDGRAVWVCDGQNWGGWSGKAGGFSGPKPIFTALDRGGVVDQTERRPAVAALRLADMDRDGVYTHVIFGPVTSINHPDAAFRDACYRVYNDWLADYCRVAPDRLLGVPMLPPYPESAVEELKRLVAKGTFKQANLQIAVADPPLRDPRWEPLFQVLEDSGMILSFHVTVFASAGAAFDPHKGSPGATFLHAKSFVEQFLDPFVDLFAFGILERHPGLKIVIAESGAGWLPWVVEELDYRHWRLWESEAYWADKGGIPAEDQAVGAVQAADLFDLPAEPGGHAAARILRRQPPVGDRLSPPGQHLAQLAPHGAGDHGPLAARDDQEADPRQRRQALWAGDREPGQPHGGGVGRKAEERRMSITITPILPTFGAEISGIDITQPLSPEDRQAVIDAQNTYGVTVYRNTGLTDETHIAFSRNFGHIELAPSMAGRKTRHAHRELFDASNLDAERPDHRQRDGPPAQEGRPAVAHGFLVHGHPLVPLPAAVPRGAARGGRDLVRRRPRGL